MFLECTRRVADKRAASPHKDTTKILNELLADEPWLNQVNISFTVVLIREIILNKDNFFSAFQGNEKHLG